MVTKHWNSWPHNIITWTIIEFLFYVIFNTTAIWNHTQTAELKTIQPLINTVLYRFPDSIYFRNFWPIFRTVTHIPDQWRRSTKIQEN